MEFVEALARSSRSAQEIGSGESAEDRGAHHWHTMGSRRCDVTCKDGYALNGPNMGVCNYHTGTWELLPGKCEKQEEERHVGCVAPQDNPENGKWKCKLTTDADEISGMGMRAPTVEEIKEFNEYNTQTMKDVVDRGLWELVPGFSRKRRATDAEWGMQLARYSSMRYLVCHLDCNEGFEPVDVSNDKIACQMTDGKWIKDFQQKKHKWFVDDIRLEKKVAQRVLCVGGYVKIVY